jgi:hypothetical protein
MVQARSMAYLRLNVFPRHLERLQEVRLGRGLPTTLRGSPAHFMSPVPEPNRGPASSVDDLRANLTLRTAVETVAKNLDSS